MSNVPVTCPKCSSENVMFSKKRQVYVCEECGHEFVSHQSQQNAEDGDTAVAAEVASGLVRVFLSYARGDDEPFVQRLYGDLTEAGFTVWFDRKSLMSRGVTFHQEIKDAIRTAVDRIVYVGGPKAAVSPYVREEWQFGLECDTVVVTPILRLGDYDLIPGELSLLHCEDFRDDGAYPVALEKLIKSLREPNPKLGALCAVPSLPANFLSRPDLMRRVRDALLVDLEKPQVITSADAKVGMQGMGGIGKSVLAAALARNRQVRAAYSDGVVWVSCGQHLTTDDLVARQRDVARHLGGDTDFTSLPQGKAVLRDLLSGKAVLIVLDDVWQAADATTFDALGPRCRMLVTTRDAGILHTLHGELVPVSLFTEEESLQLLADTAGVVRDALPPEATEVVRECGCLPLALALSGGMALSRQGDFRHVLERLRRADLDKIADRASINPQHESIWRAMQASVDMLKPEEQQRFAELAVFDTDITVPEAAVATLWAHTGRLDELDTDELLINLFERSLIQLDTKPDGAGKTLRRISLHDLLHDYAVRIAGEVRALHQKLIDAYCAKCPDGWASGPNDGYFLENLCRQIIFVEDWHELIGDAETPGVLTDLLFIQAKSAAGLVHELMSDYNAALAALPEFREENERNRRYAEAMIRYNTALREYAVRHYAWIQQKESGHATPEPEYPVRPPELENREEYAIPEEHSDRAARLRHFANFVSGHLKVLADLPADTLPLAHNWAEGPVAERAARQIQETKLPCLQRSPRPPTHPLRPQCLRTLEGHADEVTSVCVTPDARRAISGGGDWFGNKDYALRLWDLDSGACLRTLEGHTSGVHSVCITPDGRRAISASLNETLRLWDLDSGTCLRTLEGHTRWVNSVCVTPDARRAISASEDETLRLWDLDSGACLRTLEGHTEGVKSVCVTPDARRAISASSDKTLRLWDLDSGACLRTLEGHTHWVWSVCVTPDARRAISASYDNTLRLWDLDSGACLRTLEGHTSYVLSVCVTPDARRAISRSQDTTLRLWDLDSGACLRTLEGHTGGVTSVCVTPDARRAISASNDKTLRLWDLDSGACLRTLEGHTDYVLSVCVTPDARRAISGGGYHSGNKDYALRLWDLDSGACLRTLEGHTNRVTSVCVTPDGTRAISGGGDCDGNKDYALRLWDLNSGACLRTLEGHTESVTSVCVTPDARRAISASNDKTLRLWDLDSGACLRTLKGHRGDVTSVCVTPDAKRAISGCGGYRNQDYALRLWDLDSGACLAVYHAGSRVLSAAISMEGNPILCGTEDGQMHFLTPVNFPPPGLPVVTAARLWHFADGDQPGHWDDRRTVQCPWCGRRFPIRDDQLGQRVACPLEGCGGEMQLNAFVAGGEKGIGDRV